MKALPCLLAALLSLTQALHAQTIFGTNGNDAAHFILPNADGSSLMLYSTTFSGDSSSVAIAQLNVNLVTGQTKSYRYGNRGLHYWTAAAPWPGGGWLVAGKYINSSGFGLDRMVFLMRLKPNGDTLRVMRLNRHLDDRIVGLTVNARKEVTAVMHQGSSNGEMGFLKMDSAGRIRTRFRYGYQGLELAVNSHAESPLGTTAIAGEIRLNGRAMPYLLRMRDTVAKGFAYLNVDQAEALNTHVSALPGGDFLLSGSLTVTPGLIFLYAARFDTAGVLRWDRYYEMAPGVLFVNKPYVLPNGEIILPGTLNFNNAFAMQIEALQGSVLAGFTFSYAGMSAFGNLMLAPAPNTILVAATAERDVAAFRTNAALDGICTRQPAPTLTGINRASQIVYDTVTKLRTVFTQPRVPILQSPRFYTATGLPCSMLASKPSFNQNPLSLYPSPARSRVYMDGLEDKTLYALRMYDTQGKLVLRKQHRAGEPVSVQGLPGGIYRIEVSAGQTRRVGVVVVE